MVALLEIMCLAHRSSVTHELNMGHAEMNDGSERQEHSSIDLSHGVQMPPSVRPKLRIPGQSDMEAIALHRSSVRSLDLTVRFVAGKSSEAMLWILSTANRTLSYFTVHADAFRPSQKGAS